MTAYVAAQFLPVVAAMFLLLLWQHTASHAVLGGLLAFLFVSTSAWNALIQSRSWALSFERVRLVVFGGGGAVLSFASGEPVGAAALLMAMMISLPAATWAVRATPDAAAGSLRRLDAVPR